jgi:cystathionine beta-lyase/cystathionine gamma-synthase
MMVEYSLIDITLFESKLLFSSSLVTLPERMQKHYANAFKLAQFLENHPKVGRVFYPSLESHPHHQLAKALMSDFDGLLTFQLKQFRRNHQHCRESPAVSVCHFIGLRPQPAVLLPH